MNDLKTIMLVDDNQVNLTSGKIMLKDHFKVSPLPSATAMFELLEHLIPDLILLDIGMPDMDGYEAIQKLKANPEWADIPVVFLTAKTDKDSEFRGLSLGAVDYISKPFVASLLIKRIENHLFISAQKRKLKSENHHLVEGMRERSRQVLELQSAALNIVANLVEFRDDATGNHVMRVQCYLEILMNQMLADHIYVEETKHWDLDFIFPSAQLHDVGKIGITDAILDKPGPLTPDEFEIMKTHVTIGVAAIRKMEEIVKEGSFLHHSRLFAATHHEKWDGSGYPNHMQGMDIPLEGRLLAIADVYDALVSKRPYKNPIPPAAANEIIISGSGTHFDPVLVKVFEKVTDKFAAVVAENVIC